MRRRFQEVGLPALLFFLNLYFAWDLFFLEYSAWMGSIEAAYVSISRYMIENWRDLTWFPLWYGGIPFQNSYPPLLHAIVAGSSASAHVSPARAHHAVTAFFYCAGPVVVYAFALRLMRSRWYAFCAGLLFSIFSPSAFLFPNVRNDLGGYLGLRRFQDLVFYGEGPHITALALLPLALLLMYAALERRTPAAYVLAALAFASVALSNWIATFSLALGVAAFLLAQCRWDSLVRTAGISLLAYGFAITWIPPSTIGAVRYNAQFVGDYSGVYSKFLLYGPLLAATALGLKFLLQKWKVEESLQFLLLFAFLASVLPTGAEFWHVDIVPQSARYHLEMDMALCLVAPALLRWIPRETVKQRIWIGAVLIVLCFYPVKRDRKRARDFVKSIDITSTVEYQSALWLNQNSPGRAWVPGTVSFWLNAFTDTPELGGGFDQGLINPEVRIANYIIPSADGAGDKASEIARLWLRAFGVTSVEVGGANSREVYKPFRRPDVFRELPLAWQNGDDRIYRTGAQNTLAHAVLRPDIVVHPPVNGIDIAELRRYVEALEHPLAFRWTNRHTALITGEVTRDRVLAVQVNYHPGWKATVTGSPRRISKDGLGLMTIESQCSGYCTVQLSYDGGTEMRIARVLSWGTFAGAFLWIAVGAVRRRFKQFS